MAVEGVSGEAFGGRCAGDNFCPAPPPEGRLLPRLVTHESDEPRSIGGRGRRLSSWAVAGTAPENGYLRFPACSL